jgi:cytochrome P450
MVAKWDPAEALADVGTGLVDDPSQAYASLLAQCPVAKFSTQDTQMWGLFGHAEVQKAAIETTIFSNVTVPEGSPRIIPLMVDPPDHASYRRLINKFFGPGPIRATEAKVRPVAAKIIDDMVAYGTGDFSRLLAYPFATQTLCAHLAVEEDWLIFNDWASEMERLTAAGTRNAGEPLPTEHLSKIVPFVRSLIQGRRASPGEDIISGFVQGSINGAPLDDSAITGLVIALILAGRSTTASGIGNLVLRVARNLDLQRFLRANPSRIVDAVEESLRIEAPQQQMPRRALCDVEVAGQTIPAGQPVFLNYGSANLDPERWNSPHIFDLDRSKRQHFAFGHGIHQCFGAPLARMQMRLVLEELLSRTSHIEVAGDVLRLTWPRLSVERLPLRLASS